MRVKALQQVIDSQSSRLATLSTEKEAAAFGLQDESTGQGTFGYAFKCQVVSILDSSKILNSWECGCDFFLTLLLLCWLIISS